MNARLTLPPLPARPLVSVVVNNFDYERFVGGAIESALAQRGVRTEVVVVDDGSTDRSREVIGGYPAARAVYKENGGQASAFTAGFRECRGQVVIFLDADDTLLPHAAAEAVEALRGADRIKVHWPLREVDLGGSPTGRILPDYPLAEGDLLPEVIRYGVPRGWRHGLGHAYRREFLQEVMPVRDCGDGHGADSYLCVLAPIYGEIATIREPLGCYRRHGSNFARGRSVRYRLERDARRYPFFLSWIEQHLARTGLGVDTARWYGEGSALAWTRAALALERDIDRLAADDGSVVLVDDGLVASHARPGLRTMMERDGRYWGPPEDDAAAVGELERHRAGGAAYLVIANTAFWWLDHYRGFAGHLRSHYRCVAATDSSRVYDLRGGGAGEARPGDAAAPDRTTAGAPAPAEGGGGAGVG